MEHREQQYGLRLLSLDGGGIRGISELVILDEIMKRVQKKQNLSEPALPCEYFDLICGTSTGGLIAILLGRLRMSVPDAIEQYRILAKRVFSKHKAIGKDGWFKASKLEGAIQDVLKWKLGPGHEMEGMLEPEKKGICRVFVCATPGLHMERDKPRLFRTYEVDKNGEDDCTIWEAGRATSAAPMFFKRIAIGKEGMKEEFVDAALGCNNPAKQLVSEAELVFGDARDVACIVSIGTGKPMVTGFKQPLGFRRWQRLIPVDLIKAIKEMATESESTAKGMAENYKHFKRLYYRLNVERGLENIRLEEWKTLGEVKTHTKAYLNQPEVSQSIDEIVSALVGSFSPKYMLRQLGANIPNSKFPQIYDFPKGVSQFVNREGPLKEVAKAYHERRDEVDPPVVVLHGTGGSGKTQLALKYCRRTKASQRHDSIFWVDASNPKSVAHSFAAIEQLIFKTKVDLASGDASIKKVTEEISNWETSWLIVFDNFDTPSLFIDEGKNVRDYFPRGNRGAILLTSRSDAAGRLGRAVEVSKMTKDEGLELLVRISGNESIGDTNRVVGESIVSRLGYLALAIDQAGAYIRARNLAPQLFLGHFKDQREQILKEIPALWEYTKKLNDTEAATAVSVFTTWEMSFQRVKGDGTRKTNKEHLLTTSAFLDNRHIHQNLFQSYFDRNSPGWMGMFATDGSWDKYKLGLVLVELKELSLLESFQESENGMHFGIHPLIQDWMKLRLQLKDCQSYAIETIEILASYAYDLNFVDMTLQLKRAFVAHLNASIENNDHYQTKVLEKPEMKYATFRFGDFYRAQGQYAKAGKLYSLSIAAWEAQVGPTHPDTLRMMGNLAIVYELQRNFAQAEALYLKILDGFKEQLGDEHVDTLNTIHNLAIVYLSQERYIEAESLNKQALELKTKILGQKDPSTLRSASTLATTYRRQGRYEEAEHLYIRVLNDIKVGGGSPGWAAALETMESLAIVYRIQRRYGEAEHIFKEVLTLREAEFGPEHPHTCAALCGLANVFKDQNRNDEAAPFFKQALQGRENVLGVDHPDTINVREELESLLS